MTNDAKNFYGIPVVLRVRPAYDRCPEIVTIEDQCIILKSKLYKKKPYEFYFDSVYNANAKTRDIHENECQDILEYVLQGYNGCILAYGPTSTGKSYTMSEDPEGGIIQDTFLDLFKMIKDSHEKILIEMSYFEIYMNKVHDLLVKKKKRDFESNLEAKVLPALIIEDGSFIVGLSSYLCENSKDCMNHFKLGRSVRETGSTKFNSKSSRSHAIVLLRVTVGNKKEMKKGNLYLVDLAGSEKIGDNEIKKFSEAERRRINLDMLTLTNVIRALVKKEKPPYRDSMLTTILKNAIGGSSKTVFIAHISQSKQLYYQTLQTLQYTQIVRQIKNRPIVDKKPTKQEVEELLAENSKLKKEIEEANKIINDILQQKDKSHNDNYSKLEEEMQDKIAELCKNERYLDVFRKLVDEPQFIDNLRDNYLERRNIQETIKTIFNKKNRKMKYDELERDLLNIDSDLTPSEMVGQMYKKMNEMIKVIRYLNNTNDELNNKYQKLRAKYKELKTKQKQDINNSDEEEEELEAFIESKEEKSNNVLFESPETIQDEAISLIHPLQSFDANEKKASNDNNNKNKTTLDIINLDSNEYTAREIKLVNLNLNNLDNEKVNKGLVEEMQNLLRKKIETIQYQKQHTKNLSESHDNEKEFSIKTISTKYKKDVNAIHSNKNSFLSTICTIL